MRNYNLSICKDAADYIARISHGTVITHDNLKHLLKIQAESDEWRYYSLVYKVKRILESEHGIFLQTVHKMGYAIIPPGKEIEQCKGEFVRGQKTMIRAACRTEFIRFDLMSDADRTRSMEETQKMCRIASYLRLARESKKVAAS